jgi:hypothetical protein
MRRTLFVALLAASLSPNLLRAQVECTAPKNSNVAKMLAWFDGPLSASRPHRQRFAGTADSASRR